MYANCISIAAGRAAMVMTVSSGYYGSPQYREYQPIQKSYDCNMNGVESVKEWFQIFLSAFSIV